MKVKADQNRPNLIVVGTSVLFKNNITFCMKFAEYDNDVKRKKLFFIKLVRCPFFKTLLSV